MDDEGSRSTAPTSQERYRGAMLGLAAGDALGASVELAAPGSFPTVTDMTGGGPHRLPAGAWTDDTAMALCLAESLLDRACFDPVDQLQRYLRWYRYGYLSSTGECFDIGNATRAALELFERRRVPFPGDDAPHAAGNGGLMRLAPVPLAYAAHPAEAVRLAGESARTTHGDPRAIDSCRYLAALILGALAGDSRQALLEGPPVEPVPGIWDGAPLHPQVREVAEGSFRRRSPPEIRGTGFVVESLEAALWAVRSTRSYEEAVLAAANLGDDADTTAAVAGQLAGAIDGVEAIPARWRGLLVMGDLIEDIADGLYGLADAVVPGRPAVRQRAPRRLRASPAPLPAGVDSYWVHEGRLLAGVYPGAPTVEEAERKLDALLDTGVSCFLDLTREDDNLEPYAAHLRRRAHRRSVSVTCVRMAIADGGVPSRWLMRAILAAIREALDAGETVYVHCWGGVGRTGTVVGCLLREEGAGAGEVIARIAALRAGTQRAPRIAPEHETQRELVRRWTPAARPVRRIMPDLPTRDPAATRELYAEVLGLDLAMDMGWIVTYASPADPALQISLMTDDATAPARPAVSIEVADVDAVHAGAVRLGYEIVHPLTDEPWGVRRFFLRDRDGNLLNILSHG